MSKNLSELLEKLLTQGQESEWVEFKEDYHSAEEIGQRISALANGACLAGERYGYLIFGVQDQTHQVTGTRFKPKQQKAKGSEDLEFWLTNRLSPKIDFRIYEISFQDKPVVIFQIPAASGLPVSFFHEAYIRIGSYTKLLKEYPTKARLIWHSTAEDWSATICPAASIHDLDPTAIAKARQLYARKNPRLADQIPIWDDATFLNKAKLTIGGKITHTAIILLGLPESDHYILPAVAKITWILEGVDGVKKDYQHFEPPFLLAVDEVYAKIRNLRYRYMVDGTLFPEEVDQYDPYIIREALNNAIAHQDYPLGGRVTVIEREDSTLTFQNYGEFLPKSIQNVLDKNAPEQRYRNPFLVSAMVNLDLIDTIGSGIKTMFHIQRKRYFPMPDYELDDAKVIVTFTGKVLDMDYARRLAQLPDLNLNEIILLDKLQKNQPIEDDDALILRKKGLIEGRKPNYCISASVAAQTDQKKEYMEMRGLNEQHYQGLILEYLRQFDQAKRADLEDFLMDRLPQILDHEKRRNRIRNLLQKMRRQGLIQAKGLFWSLADS